MKLLCAYCEECIAEFIYKGDSVCETCLTVTKANERFIETEGKNEEVL